MDKSFKQITSLKSSEDLKEYLQKNRNLNLSIMANKNGATLLHFAAFKNDLMKLKIYFQHFKAYCQITHGNKMYESGFEGKMKAWINLADQQGVVPIHFATLHGNIQMISLFEKFGANIQFKTKQGQNILFMAVQNNQIRALIYLLEQSQSKLDINCKNNIGDNILHKAARNNCFPIATYLLTKNICADQQNNEGFTPLMEAVMANHKEIVKALLYKGVDRHIKNNESQQAIQIAKNESRTELINILNDDFTIVEKLKIACNAKIVYRVQKPTLSYALFFMFIYHLVLFPTCILTEFTSLSEDKFYVPIIIQSIYYLLTMLLYIMLLKKHPKKVPYSSLINVELPFCAECRNQKKNQYHCFICSTCVYRYDHHCPWINNCIGVKNIGRFYLFLWMIQVGALFVIFSHLCMLGLLKDFIRYRQFVNIQPQQIVYSVLCLILSVFFAFSIFLLITRQTKNLVTNTTQFQRSKKLKQNPRSSQLIPSQSDTLITEHKQKELSFLDKSQQDQTTCGCFTNCKAILCDHSNRL